MPPEQKWLNLFMDATTIKMVESSHGYPQHKNGCIWSWMPPEQKIVESIHGCLQNKNG